MRTKVRLWPPADMGVWQAPVELDCNLSYSKGETRLSDFRMPDGRQVIDLPAGCRWQMPRSVRVFGRLVVFDGVRVWRIDPETAEAK